LANNFEQTANYIKRKPWFGAILAPFLHNMLPCMFWFNCDRPIQFHFLPKINTFLRTTATSLFKLQELQNPIKTKNSKESSSATS